MASRGVALCVVLIAFGCINANPAKPVSWMGTPVDGLVEEVRSLCNDENDSFSCMKLKVMNFLDTILKKDSYKISDDIEVRSNGFDVINEARGEQGIMDKIESYVQSHDVTVNFPGTGAKVTLSPKSLNEDEFNVKVKLSSGARSAVEARKSKLKKIFIPLLVFVLLKAMTLVPLALGVLGLKAWNALQLSFFSFVISSALAVFQLCKKLATDNHHPQIIPAHGPWEHGRSIFEPTVEGQNLAYNSYN